MYGDTTLFTHSAVGKYWDVSRLKGLGNIYFLKREKIGQEFVLCF